MHGHEEIEDFHRVAYEESIAQSAVAPRPSVTIRMIDVQPLGRPRPGKLDDTTRTNAVSKISQIKDDERQFTEGIPALLWLDLQDAQNLGML